ncbi:MAG: CGNR zinc finger domain-containing protein [Acidimicrobiia bacterium]|nr:CGNR zinc finger domain-containing protein [Acidimicrobiia bacterium]MDH4306963.1 CGNR zinc finger domain-containing protein [Acidimicrobiia bacterium]MDH5292830.1 CGNR zinc finger domain-containing protein [Acidimicrobiia bacterium]
MDFSHYSCEPVDLAVDLINTDGRFGGNRDELMFLHDLEVFLAAHQDVWEPGDSLPPDETDVQEVRELRKSLRTVFEAETDDAASAVINELLATNGAIPRVSTHGGSAHLHFETEGTSFARWLAVVTTMGVTTVLVDQGRARFGVCAAADCNDVFLDTSRNRSRRHCSGTCSTRENVAAYRKRQRQE